MSLSQLSALARRQAVVLGVVLLVLLGVAYSFKKTPQTFMETGTLVLVSYSAAPNPYVTQYNSSLINTGDILVKWVDSPAGQAALQQAGAGTGFEIGLVNFYNEEYPLYTEPYLTVSGSGIGAAGAKQVFTAGVRVFDERLASLQSAAGAKPADFITARMVGDSGPIIQLGSSKRVYGGLAVLGIIAAFLLAAFFDRRGIQFRLGRQRVA
jgi:hypothetical protein